jgi:hypothetical protein
MFKNLRNTIVALLSAATLVAVPVAVPTVAFADIQDCLSAGTDVNNPQLDQAVQGSNCSPSDTTQASTSINNIIKTVVNIFSIIVGIVAVIMIIIGGFKYITSGGDSNNISSAKSTIIYAIIGLVVVALAQFIVQFVLNKVTTTGS